MKNYIVSCTSWRCRSRQDSFDDKVMNEFIKRYVKGCLPKNAVPTIGIEFAGKTVTLQNGKKVKA